MNAPEIAKYGILDHDVNRVERAHFRLSIIRVSILIVLWVSIAILFSYYQVWSDSSPLPPKILFSGLIALVLAGCIFKAQELIHGRSLEEHYLSLIHI